METMHTTARVAAAYAALDAADRPEAWIALRDRADALAEAARVDAAVAAGADLPLAGLVYAVKDNIDVAGFDTTAACPSYAYRPDTDAGAVARLRAAGAVCLGKTNLDQFATGLVGTRSPYGAVRNAFDGERIAGGSSSGSAVAVAAGIVDFALGTDTAGSGRVPAALHGIVGVKASLGVVPVDGVVPACASYDCVTVFAPGLALAVAVLDVMAGPSGVDPAARVWPAVAPLAAGPSPRLAVPVAANLAALDPDFVPLWEEALARFAAIGADLVAVDVAPLLAAALLLYEGALVAERAAAFGAHLEAHPGDADPVVAQIVQGAHKFTAADLVADQQELRRCRLEAARLLEGFDGLVLPTAPLHPTIAAVGADPVGVNAVMGTYTNFVNLLDMAAVAVPAGAAGAKRFGVSVIAPAFGDRVAIDVAARYLGEAAPPVRGGCDLVVFGAHMSGMVLNGQLTEVGARYVGAVATAPRYRMFALDTVPPKPLVVRVEEGGVCLPGERWTLPAAALGRFLAALPAPMTLGAVELEDGTWVTGFTANAPQGRDITDSGGWRAHLS